MSVELDLDIAALVGEMEALPCESVDHDPDYLGHDSGPATHYARVHCQACGLNVIKSYCSEFVGFLTLDTIVECSDCRAPYRATDLVTILGPVTS